MSYFLGIKAHRNSAGLVLTQTKYFYDLLAKKKKMLVAKACSSPMCSSTKLCHNESKLFEQPTLYRSTIGALQYLTLTRPDIAFKLLLSYLKGTS